MEKCVGSIGLEHKERWESRLSLTDTIGRLRGLGQKQRFAYALFSLTTNDVIGSLTTSRLLIGSVEY